MTKDPLFSAINLPREYEWVAGLILSWFTAWKFYSDPLKKKINLLENEFREYFGVSKTKFEHIEKRFADLEKSINEIKKSLTNTQIGLYHSF